MTKKNKAKTPESPAVPAIGGSGVEPAITEEFLVQEIQKLNAHKAQLLKGAQDIQAAAKRKAEEMMGEANAVHGAIQAYEQFLGILTEAAGKALTAKRKGARKKAA